jgi:hypothetical protein
MHDPYTAPAPVYVEQPSRYRQLQAEAKRLGIRANQSKAELEAQLTRLHAQQNRKSYEQQLSQQHEKAGAQEAQLPTAPPPKDARTSPALG